MGQNLVRNSDAKVPFTIKVLDTEEVNAFALPGGFFFVNSGLILKADSEAELAGVMAHEIAHVAARHGTKQATRGEIAQIGIIAASIVVPYGWTGYAALQGASATYRADFRGTISPAGGGVARHPASIQAVTAVRCSENSGVPRRRPPGSRRPMWRSFKR